MRDSMYCQLGELDGTPLTTAKCLEYPLLRTRPVLISVLDRPGRFVKRCLLERLRDIRLRFEDGSTLQGRIDRIAFDPQYGRICSVRIEAAAIANAHAPIDTGSALESLVA